MLAFCITFALYRYTTVQEWEAATSSSVEKLKSYAGQSYKDTSDALDTTKSQTAKEYTQGSTAQIDSNILPPIAKPIGDWELGQKQSATTQKPIAEGTPKVMITPTSSPTPGRHFGLSGQGRLDAPPPLGNDIPVIHWEHLPEHFPLPKESIIALPTDTPKPIAKLQHVFKSETAKEKSDREQKQAEIKAAFQHSWKGYKDNAWLHDELRPVNGDNRDTFCGWGATLVDALDTLWIMGLEKEFIEATEALEKIDFTTTTRTDIPLFETTIRYLGGLLSAYDVSGAKHKIILSKAQELGNILISAFDTPNRMPIMYYNWRPTFAKNPHRAGTRTVLAELGSLSMEFTRLAQLTGEDKYYDAIARITNELQIMQPTTLLPGLWPEQIDTSGCQKTISISTESSGHSRNSFDQTNASNGFGGKGGKLPGGKRVVLDALQKRQLYSDDDEIEEVHKGLEAGAPITPRPYEDDAPTENDDAKKLASPASKNDVPKIESLSEVKDTKVAVSPVSSPIVAAKAGVIPPGAMAGSDEFSPPITREKVDCLAQGLTSPPHAWSEDFKFGGAADSTYEYLPKMHLLLGGQVAQYGEMYEKAIDAANKYLLFRAMIQDEKREILVLGGAKVKEGWLEYPEGNFTLSPEQSHLLCFAGGMYAMGSKIFKREQDFEIAKKITDGCIWSYENMASGIMPESMDLIPCPSRTNCPWNETLWTETLDPYWREREENRLQAQANTMPYRGYAASDEDGLDAADFRVRKFEGDQGKEIEIPNEDPLQRRASDEEAQQSASPTGLAMSKPTETSDMDVEQEALHNMFPTHEEYVKELMENSRLPKGVPSIRSRGYILRPEAIESVFIMYRMTGDEYWREKGWKMWQAISRETKAEFGHSAIKDVTRAEYEYNHSNEMESFWLAETLKYFYLLFSPPDTISLDDWVL